MADSVREGSGYYPTPGDTVQMDVRIYNYSPEMIYDLNAVLTADDPYITIPSTPRIPVMMKADLIQA